MNAQATTPETGPTLGELRLVISCGIVLVGDLEAGKPADIVTARGILGAVARGWQARFGQAGYERAFARERIEESKRALLFKPDAFGQTPGADELLTVAYLAIRLVDAMGDRDMAAAEKIVSAMKGARLALVGRYGSAALSRYFGGDALIALYDAIPLEFREMPS